MDIGGVVSLKIYIIYPGVDDPEIRRFAVHPTVVTCFNLFGNKLAEKFPELCQTGFRVFWKDEEGDEVAISSDEELILALTSMKKEIKKFYLRLGPMRRDQLQAESYVVHPHIYCDGCECNVTGFRYKCILCQDFDLCEVCERDRIHAEHPMLRISDPYMFKRGTLQKITHYLESFFAKERHRERKHGYEATEESYLESYKKHKKYDRREPEVVEEVEDGSHRKHSHHSYKKMKKGKCPYGQVVSTGFAQQSPQHSHSRYSQEQGVEEVEVDPPAVNRFETISMAIQTFLEPLMGGNIDLEIRPMSDRKKNKKKEEQAKETPPPSPSAPQQKEVRFADAEEVTKKKVDEISKLLAKQTMNSSSGCSSKSTKNEDADGWVELEVLEKESEENKSNDNGSTGANQKVPQSTEKASVGGEKHEKQEKHEKHEKQQEAAKAPVDSQEAASSHAASDPQAPEGRTLYPDLGSGQADASVKDALDQLTSMGFTNENNLLTLLLKAKKGNVSQALEMLLDQQKKK